MIQIIGIEGIPEVQEGDDLPALIIAAAHGGAVEVQEKDIFVVAQKAVSKAEGRVALLNEVDPSPLARQWAETHGKDARMTEIVLRESRRIVRMQRGVMICETHHGFICANAGVDASNTADGTVVLLPADPDASARRIRDRLEQAFGVRVAVIISDTFGRPWREGITNVAIGIAGIAPAIDYRGQLDSFGREIRVTVVATADELAAAAELVMHKSAGIPVAVIRGYDYEARESSIGELLRASENDLFR